MVWPTIIENWLHSDVHIFSPYKIRLDWIRDIRIVSVKMDLNFLYLDFNFLDNPLHILLMH